MRLALLLAVLALPALAGEAPEPPTTWLGTATHVVAVGTLSGQPLAIAPTGVNAGPDEIGVSARRHYRTGHAGWREAVLEIRWEASSGEDSQSLVLGLGNEDFLQQPVDGPVTYALAAEPFPEGRRASLFVAAGTAGPEGAEDTMLIEGWTGTLTLTLDEGTRDADMLLLDGRIGGHLDARRGEDHLLVSFTAPVVGHARGD
jgi:hypothetical protein